jgi:allantoin racemase
VSKRILIVNPNTSETCSAGILGAARRAAGADVWVEVATVPDGPAYIETPNDEAVAARAVLRLFRDKTIEEHGLYDALIIACSSDPGLSAARATFSLPVLGIGESALLLARGLGLPYGILTTLEAREPRMWALARDYGLDRNLVSVQASRCTVEDLDLRKPGTAESLTEAGRRALDQGALTLCLGCAAMAWLDRELESRLEVPVFEGVASAVCLTDLFLSSHTSMGAPPGSHEHTRGS